MACKTVVDHLANVGGEQQGLDSDTIAAIVTGAQQGAVSIVRISGREALEVAQQVFQGPGKGGSQRRRQLETHRVYYGRAVDADGSTIDEVLLLCMLGPRSYTAEDVVEIHTHGGGICAQRVLRRCLEAGARLARPGEFTLRAFLNGRLDLSQAESVSQLIESRTVAAADSALAGMAGGLGREVHEMRAECVDLLTEMDARLDFDEDLPPLDVRELTGRIEALAQRVQRTLSTARQGQLLRTGLQVALVGRPNVGKSSLLNALSGTERAIVTEVAGTTRDIVEAGIVIGGIPITLLDTAGLRQSSDRVERIGVERSLAAAKQARGAVQVVGEWPGGGADIVAMVMDAQAGWTAGDAEIFRAIFQGLPSEFSDSEPFEPYLSGDSYDSRGEESPDEEEGGQHASSAAGRAPALLILNKVDIMGHAATTGAAAAAAAPWASEQQETLAPSNSMHQLGGSAAARGAPEGRMAGSSAVPTSSSLGDMGQPGRHLNSDLYDPYASGGSSDSRWESDAEDPSTSTLAATLSSAGASHPASSPGPSSSSSASNGSSHSALQGGSLQVVPPAVASRFSALVSTSAATGQGLDSLREAVLLLAGAPQLVPGGVAWAVNERQAEALIRAQQALERVRGSVSEGLPLDFWTIDLREAVMALGEVSGDDVTEEVLDNIFSRFCIGK
ncbi:hypothetical protein N2152v2_008002 [Parachlorella kessleri]